MSIPTPVLVDETHRSEAQHAMIESSETPHALPFSCISPQWGKVSMQFKYSLADEDWEAKARQHFFEAASALMRCGAPEITLTAYVELGVVDAARGSGSVQLEFAFSKTQLQDCLTRLASAIMDDIKVFLVSLSGGSTLQVQYIIRKSSDPTHATSPLPVDEAPSEMPNRDFAHTRTTLAVLQTPVSDSNLAAPTLSPSLRFLIETIIGYDPLVDLLSYMRFRTVSRHTGVSESARITRSPPLTAMHLHRVHVEAPNKKPSAADIVHLGRARIPRRPLQLALPDAAEASGAQPSSSSSTEPPTHNSASVMPSAYDGDLLRQICPAHLMGSACEHEDFSGAHCNRLWVCEYIEGYECQGTTCRYLHGIPRSCFRAIWNRECDACDRAHDYLDDRRANAEDLDDHLGVLEISR